MLFYLNITIRALEQYAGINSKHRFPDVAEKRCLFFIYLFIVNSWSLL